MSVLRPALDGQHARQRQSGGPRQHERAVGLSGPKSSPKRRRDSRVELCCGAQAADFVDDALELGVGSAEAYDAVRAVVPKLTADRPIHEDIEAAGALVESPAFIERVAAALDEELE